MNIPCPDRGGLSCALVMGDNKTNVKMKNVRLFLIVFRLLKHLKLISILFEFFVKSLQKSYSNESKRRKSYSMKHF